MACVLITGCSSGIGLQTALVLANAGHKVYATMRKPERAPALAEIAAEKKLPIVIVPLDVDSDESVRRAFATVRSQGAVIDVLVNNAALERNGSIEETPLEQFRAAMETNYLGPLRCIRACLPEMRQRRSGCIINISSVAGRIAVSPMAPYSATKFALEAISEVLAQEVKPFNIRVAIVEPGIIDTPMARGITVCRTESEYLQPRRWGGMFAAALANPAPPTLIADKIRDIIESGTWKLRHPAGPDAEGFLAWRASLTDEDLVDWAALDDNAWYERVRNEFGLDARPRGKQQSAVTR